MQKRHILVTWRWKDLSKTKFVDMLFANLVRAPGPRHRGACSWNFWGFPFSWGCCCLFVLAVVTQQWHIIEQASPVSLSLLARFADLYNLLIQVDACSLWVVSWIVLWSYPMCWCWAVSHRILIIKPAFDVSIPRHAEIPSVIQCVGAITVIPRIK